MTCTIYILAPEKQYYQEKETLIADTYTNLSHDIRTPLTSLDGYIQLMEECENIEDQKRYLSIVHERIHSLNEMLEELFMFTKLKKRILQFGIDVLLYEPDFERNSFFIL